MELIAGDTFGDPEQAIALAKALIARQVVFVAGPATSEAAIAAAPVLEEAKIIAISPSASNPKLTESGWRNVFRVFGRDDRQGGVAAAYLGRPLGRPADRHPRRRHRLWPRPGG